MSDQFMASLLTPPASDHLKPENQFVDDSVGNHGPDIALFSDHSRPSTSEGHSGSYFYHSSRQLPAFEQFQYPPQDYRTTHPNISQGDCEIALSFRAALAAAIPVWAESYKSNRGIVDYSTVGSLSRQHHSNDHPSFSPITNANSHLRTDTITPVQVHGARKRKASFASEAPPSKRLATPAISAVSKPRATAGHGRKRSNMSESHQVGGDVRQKRQPANKPAISKNYKDWPDFSPDAATLDTQAAKDVLHGFRPLHDDVHMKDLSDDNLAHELHPVELAIASRLNLDCGRYLVTKRSVFSGYVWHLLYKRCQVANPEDQARKGLTKAWNKTAAQTCSSIDVNKTSRLYEDFWIKLGWFDEAHFEKYLANPSAVVFPEFDPKDGHVVVEGGFFS